MAKLVVFENITLDGVAQSPARPDEDARGGVNHGGWAVPYSDAAAMGRMVAEGMCKPGGLLLGRQTYENFYEVWPKRGDDGNPFTEALNKRQKFVASRSLREPLPWANSTLLEGDAAEAVARLKQREIGDLMLLGSIRLVHSLIGHNLVDRYVLLTYPVILGSGLRLFPEGALSRLRLVDSSTTKTGVVIATYEPEE